MKLIIEQFDSQKATITESESGRKDVYIEGTYAQTKLNRNGRVYPKAILAKQVEKYLEEQVKTGKAMGELNHPQTLSVNPKEVCMKVEQLKWVSEEDVWGKAKLTNTPNGNLVRNLVVDDGITLGVSTRGVGSVITAEGIDVIQNDFFLKCWDVVTDPSAPDAFVNGVMESKEWLFVDGILVEREIASLQKEIDKAVVKNKLSPANMDAFMESLFKRYT